MIMIIRGSVQIAMVPSTIAAIKKVNGNVQIDNVYIACTDSTADTHQDLPVMWMIMYTDWPTTIPCLKMSSAISKFTYH